MHERVKMFKKLYLPFPLKFVKSNMKHHGLAKFLVSKNCCLNFIKLTHFSPMSHLYTPWKSQKTLTFSGVIEMWHWTKMGYIKNFLQTKTQEKKLRKCMLWTKGETFWILLTFQEVFMIYTNKPFSFFWL